MSFKKNVVLIIGFLSLALINSRPATAQAWTPPIGVPVPPFGITNAPPARPNPWTGQQSGFYYVDSAGGCSDSRANGFPGSARCTIPGSLAAGAYVELHGTYNTGNALAYNGTAANPIFITGQTYALRPLITAGWGGSNASYLILQNLTFGPSDPSASDFGVGLYEGMHHVALRSVEFSGNLNKAGGLGIGTWGQTDAATVNNVVLKDSYIHNLGNVNDAGDRDAHCITVNGNVQSLWIVDNELFACEGDGIQVEAQHERGMSHIHHIYIGRNKSHGHKQSSTWVKHAQDVVISQNDFYGQHQSAVTSDLACTGVQYDPSRVWFLYNRIHDCNIGIAINSGDGPGDGSDTYIIGNLIYRIAATNPTDTYNAGCVAIRGDVNVYVINNTMYDCDGGVYAPPSGVTIRVVNNIFANRHAATGKELSFDGPGASTVANNLFYRSGGISINWNGSIYTGVPFGGQCTSNCSTASPAFVNAPADFSLASTSAALDNGQVNPVYATFQSLYGLTIAYDVYGGGRPIGAGWDIGANEYGSTGVPPPPGPTAPSSPTNLRIIR